MNRIKKLLKSLLGTPEQEPDTEPTLMQIAELEQARSEERKQALIEKYGSRRKALRAIMAEKRRAEGRERRNRRKRAAREGDGLDRPGGEG